VTLNRGTRASRPGHSNAEFATAALRAALEKAHMGVRELDYLIGHTTSPGNLVPPNVAAVADLVGFAGPYMELRQACSGFTNALAVAQGLVSVQGVRAVAIVGSETASVYFDPRRAGSSSRQHSIIRLAGCGKTDDRHGLTRSCISARMSRTGRVLTATASASRVESPADAIGPR
jgi:3-oxoacyl-[acyl-carrier-protein] synthase III